MCETPLATGWARNEGWNPGVADSLVFNAADPDSLIAVESAGEPVGVISSIRMTDDFGFIGFFVLHPDYRRSFYGPALVEASLERMGDRVIGADGLSERLRTYANLGFKPYYQTTTYQGHAPIPAPKWRPGVVLASGIHLAKLVAYDAMGFGVPRTAILREWLNLPDSLSLMFEREGRLCGMGTARRCTKGVRIGPLQADDPEVAEALFDALGSLAPGEAISIDSPETNPEGAKLFRKKGFVAGIATTRVYRGLPPANLSRQVYGQMSFALG